MTNNVGLSDEHPSDHDSGRAIGDLNRQEVGAPTSGLLTFSHDYNFADGGPVEAGRIPYPADAPAPFEVARWSVSPGTTNDLDVHLSREIWLVVAGTGEVTWADCATRLKAGDAIAFDSRVPHQVVNDGDEDLTVFSVFWKQGRGSNSYFDLKDPASS